MAPSPAALRGTPGAAPEANANPLQKATSEVLEAAKLLNGETGAGEEKRKVKEAESIKLPDFSNPETYRGWKISTREAVRAASDRPDEAFDWILAVYDRHAGHSSLRDLGKFVTLDTKLLAALTKVAKGELARQILNFKETEAAERRAVRGRQVLYLFDQHFKTNEEVGSLYSVEDLLKVNLLQDDLSTFIHNWESVVAGMSHVPDERTLRDILLRQIRRSARMKWDLDLYDRAKEGTPTHSYSFLIQSIRDLLTRERVRRNRDRIAKSHGDKFGAPAPRREGTRPQSGGRGRPPSRDSNSNASFRSRSSSREDPKEGPLAPRLCATTSWRESALEVLTVSSFTRTDPRHRSRLTSKRRSTRFVCTGRKGSVLEVTSVDFYTNPTRTKRHHRLDLQERKTPPPRLPKSQDLLHPPPREGQAEEGRKARGQRQLPAASTRRPLAMLGMPFKGRVLPLG